MKTLITWASRASSAVSGPRVWAVARSSTWGSRSRRYASSHTSVSKQATIGRSFIMGPRLRPVLLGTLPKGSLRDQHSRGRPHLPIGVGFRPVHDYPRGRGGCDGDARTLLHE